MARSSGRSRRKRTSIPIIGKLYQRIFASSMDTVLDLYKELGGGGYAFRGQADKKWNLCTNFERAAEGVPPDKWVKLEQKVNVEFKRRAQHYLSDVPAKDKHLEWLALMQHYGCPTRLLDFTRSYFVALFFAVEDACSDSSVWAVSRTSFEIPAWDDPVYAQYNKNTERIADDVLSSSDKNKQNTGVRLVEPYRMNERLSIQQGLFLLPGNLTIPFEENLCTRFKKNSLNELEQMDGDPAVVKIVIPKRLHLPIALFLNEMNISSSTLFPGLEGYARSQKLHIQLARFHTDRQQRRARINAARIWKGLAVKDG